MRGDTKGGSTVAFGEYGLKTIDRGWLTNRQIEAARVAMTRKIKRGGKVWINVFPDKPYTKKPAETRMGSGKGNPEGWVAVVKPGKVMFELAGVPEELAREALRLAGHKLPVRTKFVKREGAGAVKAAEVHNLKDDELVEKLINAKEEAFNLRFRHATGELENTARLGQAKRDVARLITVARERGIDVEKETRRSMSDDEHRDETTEDDSRGAAGRGDSGRGGPCRRGAEAPARRARRPRPTPEPAEPDPLDDLPWKERRRVLQRSREPHKAGPQQTIEERAAARASPPQAEGRTNGAKNAPR